MNTRKVTDYHDMVNIDTPVAERRRLNIGDIWINQAKCEECGESVRSRNKHDFRSCSCGNITVDGGSWYGRRLYKPGAKYTDESVNFNIIE